MITTVNIYRNKGEWCYAAFADSEFDHSDTLGISGPESDATSEAIRQFPGADVLRVADTEI